MNEENYLPIPAVKRLILDYITENGATSILKLAKLIGVDLNIIVDSIIELYNEKKIKLIARPCDEYE